MPAVESRKRNSILGSLALLLAAPAVALNYFDFPGLPNVVIGQFEWRFPMAVAASVTALAFLSFMLASKSRRTGTEIPVAALLVAGAALGLGYYRHRIPPAAPTANVPAPTTVKTPAPQGTPVKPPPRAANSKSPALPNPSNVASQAKTLANTSTDAALRQRNLAQLREAESEFDAAKASVIKSLEFDSAYVAAKAESDSTLETLKQARAAYAPGSPPLITASQNALIAHDKLQTIIDLALDKDTSASQAKARLDAVKASFKRPAGGGKP